MIMIMSIFSKICMLYPAYRSFKAVKYKDTEEQVQLVKYWMVFAALNMVEGFVDYIGHWIPLYELVFKVPFIVWIISPTSSGHRICYDRIIHPILEHNETEIDHFFEEASKIESYLPTLIAKGVEIAKHYMPSPLKRFIMKGDALFYRVLANVVTRFINLPLVESLAEGTTEDEFVTESSATVKIEEIEEIDLTTGELQENEEEWVIPNPVPAIRLRKNTLGSINEDSDQDFTSSSGSNNKTSKSGGKKPRKVADKKSNLPLPVPPSPRVITRSKRASLNSPLLD